MTLSTEELSLIRKYAIKNAVDYGKASVGSVLGKAMSQIEDARDRFADVKSAVEKTVSDVNAMAKDAIAAEYKSHEDEFADEYKQKVEATAKPKIVIEGAAKGDVVTRFSPEPGGYLHLGSMKHCILNEAIAHAYDGRINLYFDDTNPEKSKQEYVDGIKRDTSWMGVKFAAEYYASDSIEKVYDSGRKLLRDGNAYACLCSDSEIEEGRKKLRGCVHRNQRAQENLAYFEDMLNGKYDEGKIVIRFMGNMESPNGSLRDPVLFRIKRVTHYRHGDKYSVWPTYHMNTPVLDSMHGVTDVLRGKEYETWGEVNAAMLKDLDITPPRMHYEARLRIIGAVEGKRNLRKLIESGQVKSWDDPRLITISALRRRGVRPEAIRSFIMRFGLSKTDGRMSLDMLLAENKKYVDPIAKHLYFVRDPVKLTVRDADGLEASMKLHPSADSDMRQYKVNGVFYISGADAAALKTGDRLRLKDFRDIKIDATGHEGIAASLDESKGGNARIVQWVADNHRMGCTVMIPKDMVGEDGEMRIADSLETAMGYVEDFAGNLDERDVVQFERFGYCTLDKKEDMSFIYLSK